MYRLNKYKAVRGIAKSSICLILLIGIVSCDDNPVDVDLSNAHWDYIGPSGVAAWNLEVAGEILYLSGSEYGLMSYNYKENMDWKLLGLADSSGLEPPRWGVADVDIFNDTLLVAVYNYRRGGPLNERGVWRSEDNGVTWIPSDSGMLSADWMRSSMWSIKRSPDKTNILVTSYPIYKSGDGGKIWQLKYPDRNRIGSFPFVHKIKWNAYKPGEVWVFGSGGVFNPTLRKSEDYGETWEFISLNLGGDTPIYYIEFDNVANENVYLGSYFGLLVSTNGGDDWINSSWNSESPPPFILSNTKRKPYRAITSHPKNLPITFLSEGEKLYYTKDSGKTFEILSSEIEITILSMKFASDGNSLFIGTYDGIYVLNF